MKSRKYLITAFFLTSAILMVPLLKPQAETKCVQIYYDTSDSNGDGHMFAIMLANLIGHFPEYQRYVISIDKYKKDDVNKCQANFYLGTIEETTIPEEFLNDLGSTKSTIVWMGRGFLNIKDIEDNFGIKYDGLTKINIASNDLKGIPGFFREIIYKNQSFIKSATVGKNGQLYAATEISRFIQLNSNSEALATTKHTTTGEILPWVLKKDNMYLFSEIPLNFITESDRYLVLADLLFDILDEKPQHPIKPALIRLEDVHSFISLQQLNRAMNILESEQILPAISLIPIFRDPLHQYAPANGVDTQKMSENPTFKAAINNYSDSGATILWHGVTHQYKNVRNPWSGVSADDYEFWDATHNRPIVEDSSNYVLNRLHTGAVVLHESNIHTKIWMTPHYGASVLDTLIFGNMFDWVIGRISYFSYKATGIPETKQVDKLRFDKVTQADNLERQKLFKKLSVKYLDRTAVDQFYPYEIYGDYYHQRVLPENLGYYDPVAKRITIEKRDINQILEDAKRNSVIRDAWASVFFHTYLLENEDKNDKKTSLYKIINGIKKLGYEFVDLKNFADTNLPKYKSEIIDIK